MKTKIDEYPYNAIDYFFEDGLPEDCDCTYVIKNFHTNMGYVLNSLLDEKVSGFYYLKFEKGETKPSICNKLDIRVVQYNTIEKKLKYILNHPSKRNLVLYGIESLKLTQDINRLRADLEKKKKEMIEQLENCQISEEEKKRQEFINYASRFELDELNLKNRTRNALHREGIFYVGEVLKRNPKDIRNIRDLGEGSFNNLVEELKKLGINFWH